MSKDPRRREKPRAGPGPTKRPWRRLLGGAESELLWEAINKLNRPSTLHVWDAMYFLACRCQELEDQIIIERGGTLL